MINLYTLHLCTQLDYLYHHWDYLGKNRLQTIETIYQGVLKYLQCMGQSASSDMVHVYTILGRIIDRERQLNHLITHNYLDRELHPGRLNAEYLDMIYLHKTGSPVLRRALLCDSRSMARASVQAVDFLERSEMTN